MITEISLHNWKSFEDSTLLIDQITFLIGTNASGKSNIVDALMFLSRLSGGERLAEVCKSIRGGIDQIIRRGCDETKISVTFKSENSEYRYSISFSVDRADAFINEESLELRLRDDSWRSLFNTDPITPGDSCGQITARFDKDRPGPRKGISLRRDMTVLSQIQGQVVLKQIKDGAKATLDSFASIYVLDPSPAKMREFSPLSETLKADGSNVAGVIAALPEEETADFEDRLTKHVSKLPEKDIHASSG